MSTKEPWNNEIYRAMKEESTEMKRHDRGRDESKRPLTTRFLTFLVILMFILVGLAIGFIYGITKYEIQLVSQKVFINLHQ